MPVPSFQDLMLPILEFALGDNERTTRETVEHLAARFSLTEQERNELLPSGRQRRFSNRVGWALTHLRKAGLLRSTGHGRFTITDEGRRVLAQKPDSIDIRFLEQFDGFSEFRSSSREHARTPEPDREATLEQEETPEEVIERAYQQARQLLAAQVLREVLNQPADFFERLVIQLLVQMGFGDPSRGGSWVGRSGDGGIDGIIYQDKLGLDVVYVQAKRWADGAVGRPEIQKFVGALHGKRAKKGVFVTTAAFTREAREYVERVDPRVVLIDGQQLAELMIDHDLGVTTVRTYKLKRIDSDFFTE